MFGKGKNKKFMPFFDVIEISWMFYLTLKNSSIISTNKINVNQIKLTDDSP